jgi:hypothetical protein
LLILSVSFDSDTPTTGSATFTRRVAVRFLFLPPNLGPSRRANHRFLLFAGRFTDHLITGITL